MELKHLHYVSLHEFGTVDLLPVGNMPQLKGFALQYADKVINIGIIGSMRQLEELVLIGLHMDNLDILDLLPDTLQLELCGIDVQNQVDPAKWKRFSQYDISEITVGDNPFNYIDLSVLENNIAKDE